MFFPFYLRTTINTCFCCFFLYGNNSDKYAFFVKYCKNMQKFAKIRILCDNRMYVVQNKRDP